ncbi:MAG: hypothetical protein M3P96_08415 [Actinomycetota bacterium]|nr:hypothetical protein [Actinomycetota bacterium]
MAVVASLDHITGFCYTQFADTYQEVNGLLYADRRPKAPLDAIAAATLGPQRLRHGVLQPAHPVRVPALPPLVSGPDSASGITPAPRSSIENR